MNLNAAIEKLIAGRWIAGYYPQDALDRAKAFNQKGISTMINYLGEDIVEKEKVHAAVEKYLFIIRNIKSRKLKAASISIKPTQLGLSISYKLMYSNYLKIIREAKNSEVFIWFDMEEPNTIEQTMKAYKSAMHNGNTGICIQAYLKRSQKDVEKLLQINAIIRVVKGATK